MRSLLLLLLPAALLPLAACSVEWTSAGGYRFNQQGARVSNHIGDGLTAGIRHLEVDHRFGAVRIEGVDGSFGWDWEIQVWGDSEAVASRMLDLVSLEVSREGDRAELKLELPEPPAEELNGIHSNLTVRVPREAEVEVRSAFGDVLASDLHRPVRVVNQHGDVSLQRVGPVHATTSFGELSARRFEGGRLENRHGGLLLERSSASVVAETSFGSAEVRIVEGDLTLHDQHGQVVVEDVRGNAELHTSFNSLQVEDVGGDLIARNHHGRIEARAIAGGADLETSFNDLHAEVGSGRVRLLNQHGGIRLVLTGEDYRRIEARTRFGDVVLEAPGDLSLDIDSEDEEGRRATTLRGTTARIPVELRAEHGEVRVAR